MKNLKRNSRYKDNLHFSQSMCYEANTQNTQQRTALEILFEESRLDYFKKNDVVKALKMYIFLDNF